MFPVAVFTASTSNIGTSPRFAFEGIGQLLEHLLISEAKRIRIANANGIRKMIRNILALQQSIKTLTNDIRGTDFDRAKKYYSLFFRTPAVRVSSVGDVSLNSNPMSRN